MKVAIIGAGMTGLSIAYFLSKKGVSTDVFEAQGNVGGLAGSFSYEGISIDKFYHHFYIHDTEILNLIDELGLSKDIIWQPSKTGMYFTNKLYRLSSPLDLLRFKALPLLDRFKMGFAVLSSQAQKSYKELENISAKDWMIKKAGIKSFEVMWEPLLRGKFGKYAEKVSAAWLWSKFMKRGASRTKGGHEKLGYLNSGLENLFKSLLSKLTTKDIVIKTNNKIKQILINKGSVQGLENKSGNTYKDYDIVISTLSNELTANLVDSNYESYKNSLLKVKYLANVTLILFSRKSLSSYYWININDQECPFLGVIEHTRLANINEYKGLNVIYIPKYLTKEDDFFHQSKDTVLKRYQPWLSKIFKGFQSKDIKDYALSKDIYTQPLILTGYNENIPATKTPIKNFYLVNMAQIYPDDRQLSNSIKYAKSFAESITDKG